MSELTFGRFLTDKRKQADISLRKLAFAVELSPVYICDIEKDRRPAPAQPILDRIAEELHLTSTDRLAMYDLAGKSKNAVPVDLPDYIIERDIVRVALRKAKEVDATDEEWQDFIDRITKRKR